LQTGAVATAAVRMQAWSSGDSFSMLIFMRTVKKIHADAYFEFTVSSDCEIWLNLQ